MNYFVSVVASAVVYFLTYAVFCHPAAAVACPTSNSCSAEITLGVHAIAWNADFGVLGYL